MGEFHGPAAGVAEAPPPGWRLVDWRKYGHLQDEPDWPNFVTVCAHSGIVLARDRYCETCGVCNAGFMYLRVSFCPECNRCQRLSGGCCECQ